MTNCMFWCNLFDKEDMDTEILTDYIPRYVRTVTEV